MSTSISGEINVREHIDRYPFDRTCHWDAEEFNFDTLSSPVSRVHFCAAANDNDNDTVRRKQPVNHWMIFLETRSTASVRLSISSGETEAYPALIELVSKRYNVSYWSPRVVSANVTARGITIEAIFKLLIAKGRDRYKFTKEHVGCRYWCYCLAYDLETAGWIERGTAKHVMEAASWYYPQRRTRLTGDGTITESREPVPCPMEQGTFFWLVIISRDVRLSITDPILSDLALAFLSISLRPH